MNSPQRKRKQVRNFPRGKRQQQTTSIIFRETEGQGPIINLTKWHPAPPRVLARLQYQTALTLSGASTQVARYFYPNGAFDTDPNVGNLTLNGFNEWSAFYGVNRVINFYAKITAVNLEAFPVRIATGFFPAAVTTMDITKWGSLHAVEHQMLGPLTGQCRSSFSRKMAMPTLIGTEAYSGDLTQYYGTSGSNPTSLASFNIQVASTSASLLANGVTLAVEFFYDIEFSYENRIGQV
jgi:hypothetical protein